MESLKSGICRAVWRADSVTLMCPSQPTSRQRPIAHLYDDGAYQCRRCTISEGVDDDRLLLTCHLSGGVKAAFSQVIRDK